MIRGEKFSGNAYACEYAEMNYLKKLAKELDITKHALLVAKKMHDEGDCISDDGITIVF